VSTACLCTFPLGMLLEFCTRALERMHISRGATKPGFSDVRHVRKLFPVGQRGHVTIVVTRGIVGRGDDGV